MDDQVSMWMRDVVVVNFLLGISVTFRRIAQMRLNPAYNFILALFKKLWRVERFLKKKKFSKQETKKE